MPSPQKCCKLHTVFRINHVIDNFVVIQDGFSDIPVSYTHLDVYKRQVGHHPSGVLIALRHLGSALGVNFQKVPVGVKISSVGVGAVSYTHLVSLCPVSVIAPGLPQPGQ